MKKLTALMVSILMVLSLAACGTKDVNTDADSDAQTSGTSSDMEYVKEKGTLIVGITDFKPMDYKDEDGNWVGFDADMATAFAESLGVEVEFIEIEWDNKIMELEGKTIDCVWNGMTLVDEVLEGMACSNPYCKNSQVVVVPADKADQFKTEESLAGHTFAVEAGSAGEKAAKALNLETTPVTAQADALMEVSAGTSDAAIIDLLMAGAMIGEGTGYANLTYTLSLNSEEYGVGFRKGSDLAKALNEFFVKSYSDGLFAECAKKHSVSVDVIIPQE